MTEPETTEATKATEEPDLIMGLVLKIPGKDAVVSSWAWHRAPSTVHDLPPKAAMVSAFQDWIDQWYGAPLAPRRRTGTIKNLGDLIGELFYILPALPNGTEHKVAFEKHGEHFEIDTADFDERLVDPDPEYVSEGTDMVLLTGPGD